MNEEEEKNNSSLDNEMNLKGKAQSQKDKKAKRRKRLLKATPVIAIVLTAMILVSCFTAVVNIVIEAVGNIGNAIVNFFTGPQTSIVLSEEQIDQLIEQIEATGIDLEDLELLR